MEAQTSQTEAHDLRLQGKPTRTNANKYLS